MGFWGSGLYENDTTCDVRDTYMNYLMEGISNDEAFKKTVNEYNDCIGDNNDEEPFFWLALAETQWSVGRLTPEVKAKALEWIDRGVRRQYGIMGRKCKWGEGWKKTLEELKTKLESPMRSEKKIRKPAKIDMNLWNVNDIYAYQFHDKISKENDAYGKYMLIQKIGEGDDGENIKMRIHVFDRLFEELPTIEEMNGLRILPLDYPNYTHNLRTNILMFMWNKKGYPSDYLTYIGNKPAPPNVVTRACNYSEAIWEQIEYFSRYFKQWHGVNYETIEEGIFTYVHKTDEE